MFLYNYSDQSKKDVCLSPNKYSFCYRMTSPLTYVKHFTNNVTFGTILIRSFNMKNLSVASLSLHA